MQVDYDIRAPAGGFRQVVEDFLGDESHRFIDLVVSAERGRTHTVRMYPNRETVYRDSTSDDLIHFSGGTCYVLVNGEETGLPHMCSGRVNLQIKSKMWEAGKLGILFEEGDPL